MVSPKANNKLKATFITIKKTLLTRLSPFVIIAFGDTIMKEKEIIENRYNTVSKANELIQKSRYSLSTQQQKIILYLISQINPYATEFKKTTFKIKDFCQVCGIDCGNGNNYITLKEQIKKIADKSCWIKLENGKETLLRWIEKPYIDENNGTIEIVFDKDMKPYLLQLKERFTQYELCFPLLFKSKYTIRLFELLESYHFHKLEQMYIEFSVEELKRLLDCENYKQFKDFNTRVLKPAVNELNEKSMYNIDFDCLKDGRKIVKIRFNKVIKNTLEQLKTRSESKF